MRLIDTPGITSTVIKDTANCAKILEFISSLEHLHGVCVLIKPDLSRITPDFMYSLLMFITRLGRSAADNIIFLFTRTRRSNYMALDTITCMKPKLEEIATKQHLVIPLRYKKAERKNCFCFENECFNYLVARAQGVQMSTSRRCLEESWNVSKNSMSALMNYMVGDSENWPLPKYILQNFEQVHAARVLIFEMTIVLIDVAELMCTNIQLFEYQRSNQKHGKDVNEINITPNKKLCTQLLKIAVATCMKCRTDCNLTNVQEECLSNGLLKHKMLDTCKECLCDSTMHLFRYYKKREVYNPASGSIAIPLAKYYAEFLQMLDCLGIFAKFLGQQSFKVIEDVYDVYLSTLIATEETARGDNRLQIKRYKQLRQKYRTIKDGHEEIRKHTTAGYVIDLVEKLKTLSYSGAIISELHDLRNECHPTETPMEVVNYEVAETTYICKATEIPQMPIITSDVKAEKTNRIINILEGHIEEASDKLIELTKERYSEREDQIQASFIYSKPHNKENGSSFTHVLESPFYTGPSSSGAGYNKPAEMHNLVLETNMYTHDNSVVVPMDQLTEIRRNSDSYNRRQEPEERSPPLTTLTRTYAQVTCTPPSQPIRNSNITQECSSAPQVYDHRKNNNKSVHSNYSPQNATKYKRNENERATGQRGQRKSIIKRVKEFIGWK